MPDVEQQLHRLDAAGFTFETFEMFPNAIGVLRDGAVALLRPTPEGLQMIGTPGWRMGKLMGVLVEAAAEPHFRCKGEKLPATPERLEALRRFHQDLATALGNQP